MHELDPFEIRLRAAVRSIADDADTRVDAAALARNVIGHRPFRLVAWPEVRLPLRLAILLVLGLTLALVAGLMLVGSPRVLPAVVVALPSPTGAPTAVPSAAGIGDAHVSGSGTFSITAPGTSALVGEITQVRGFVAASTDRTNDPRATGTGTLRLSVDSQGLVGREWGTYRLETPAGAWEGPVAGGAWASGEASHVSGWLVGSGGYAGLTYYIDVRSSSLTTQIEGVIYAGTPPTP